MRKIDRVKRRFVERVLKLPLTGKKAIAFMLKKLMVMLKPTLVTLVMNLLKVFLQWSLRLLADKAVELGYVEDISHETVRHYLKKRNQTLAKERMGNSPGTKQ